MTHNINYNSASALRSFLEKEGLAMRKKFGQNFLINPAVRKTLSDALCAGTGDEVWEIGPGLGAMTALLLEKGLRVKAFEIDTGFIKILKSIFANNKNFNIVEGDCLKTWNAQEPADFLFGNLPYNIAAVLLADLIEKNRIFSRIVVTVQKETALRMAARPGSKDYSSFSVLCSSVYKVTPIIPISPSSFYPSPNVESMGVLLEADQEKIKMHKPDVFYKLVRALFSSRRKTVKNNLLSFIAAGIEQFPPGSDKQKICESILSDNGLSGNERAEKLGFEIFLSLAKSIENMRK